MPAVLLGARLAGRRTTSISGPGIAPQHSPWTAIESVLDDWARMSVTWM